MKIALLPGDGIGPEITKEAVRVLDVLRREGLSIETEDALVGGAAFDAHGDPQSAHYGIYKYDGESRFQPAGSTAVN